MNLQKVSYLAAFLTEEAKAALLAKVPPRHPKVYAHHLTVAFKPTEAEVLALPFGRAVTLRAVGVASDEKGQAVLVETDLSRNAHPHVTVSVAEGTSPVYSNQLLEASSVERFAEPLALEARLGAFVDGKEVFSLESEPAPALSPRPCSGILIPSKVQVDTLVAIFLLQRFGREQFPGVEAAPVSIYPVGSAVPEGAIALDCGGGEFDHHGQVPPVTASQLVAARLGIAEKPSVRKMLDLARRDDVEGKGIVSTDQLDRAFGLPGLLASATRGNPGNPDVVVRAFVPILEAHYLEEEKRTEGNPKLFAELVARGEAETFSVRQRGRTLKVVVLSSDDPSMSGFLRSNRGGDHDLVAMWEPSGQAVITTHPRRRPDISKLAAVLRQAEALLNGREIPAGTDLAAPRRIDVAPEWYYDPATNALLNGGAGGVGVPATKIPHGKLRALIERGLAE